jgi:hypothetical protein
VEHTVRDALARPQPYKVASLYRHVTALLHLMARQPTLYELSEWTGFATFAIHVRMRGMHDGRGSDTNEIGGTHLQLYLTVKAREHATLVRLHGANATRLHAIVTDTDMVKDTASLQAIASSSKRAWMVLERGECISIIVTGRSEDTCEFAVKVVRRLLQALYVTRRRLR